MTNMETINIVKRAHSAMRRTQQALKGATATRDAAVTAAYIGGMSAIELADALELSRQQIHKIVEATMQDLRAEVIGGVKYADLVEDDQMHVDSTVRDLARRRGAVDLDRP